MRLLAIHLTSPTSSEAKVLGTLLRHLQDGIEVTLVLNRLALEAAGSFFRPLASRSQVEIRGVDVGLPLDMQAPRPLWSRIASRLYHLLARAEVVSELERHPPDLVYTSQQRFDCKIGTLVSRRLGVPHAVHLHYTTGPWLGSSALDRLRTCDQVIAVSDFIARMAADHGVPPSKLVMLPNAIEPSGAESGVIHAAGAGRPLVVGQTGRMAPGKGFADSIRAFAGLRRHVPTAELVLVGDGRERPALEALVRDLGLDGAVRFLGWQADVSRCLQAMDIFINPSRQEPFGLSVLEASRVGLPVVAYDEGGIPEIVQDGKTGLLVRPGDTHGLTRALVALGTDEALRTALGAAARLRAARVFDPAAAGRAFSAILTGTAGSFGQARPPSPRAA